VPDIQVGRVIAGKLRLTRQLGQGGMGSVWAALHQTLGREVAVKFLQPQAANSQVLEDRFESEARMVASIKHRFVVDVFDYGMTEDGLHYMVLELLHGRSLADRMDHGPAMPVRTAVKLMSDCLRGLHVVHEAGIIHRDLKPDNIFVIEDQDGAFPKLIDFGISRRTDPPNLKLNAEARSSRLTQPGVVLGTPYYMSPEQLRGKQSVDARSDIYSFGVILYELLAGHLPFRQDNIGDLMVAITVTGAPPLAVLRPELGTRLSDVVSRAMSPVPEQRHADARELRKALLELLPELPLQAMCVIQNIVDTHPGRGDPLNGQPPEPTRREDPLLELLHSPTTDSVTVPHTRTSLMLAIGLGIALLAWFTFRQLTAETSDARMSAREASGQLTLPPLEVIDIQNRTPNTPTAPSTEEAAPAEAIEDDTIDAPPLASSVVYESHERTKVSAPGDARKPAREKARVREQKPRTVQQPDRPQRLYKKLDF
jgi:serine/threonine protein kinase